MTPDRLGRTSAYVHLRQLLNSLTPQSVDTQRSIEQTLPRDFAISQMHPMANKKPTTAWPSIRANERIGRMNWICSDFNRQSE